MIRRSIGVVTILLLTPGVACAADLNVSVSVTGEPRVSAGLSGVSFAGGSLGFGVSHRAVTGTLERRLDLSVVGTAALTVNAGYALSGGGMLGVSGRGSVGPVAASVNASAWSAPLNEFDPLAQSGFAGASTLNQGWSLEASGRYRLQRDLVAFGLGEFGAQANVAAGVEWRRDATWTVRAGVRGGDAVLGALLGATWRSDDVTLTADALLGPSSLGVTGSLSYAEPLDVPSNLTVFAAYEPWRQFRLPFRLGVALEAELERGRIMAEVHAGSAGVIGTRVRYVLPLSVADDE